MLNISKPMKQMSKLFLAAMSCSVCPFVCPFFSFSVLGVVYSPEEFQWCFKKVQRLFEVSRVFKEVSRMFHGSLKCVYRIFKGCFREVKRVFQGSFKRVSRKLQGNLKVVSRKFQGSFD